MLFQRLNEPCLVVCSACVYPYTVAQPPRQPLESALRQLPQPPVRRRWQEGLTAQPGALIAPETV